MTIWKYQLIVGDRQAIALPKGAKLLSIQIQYGIPCLWALVEPKAPKELRKILTRGTGQEFDSANLVFLGTYQLSGGSLVFHVFEEVG